MRILHLTDRLSSRGGADWHLLGVLESLASAHDLLLAVERDDGSARAPCPVATLAGLGSRTRAAVSLDALAARFQADLIHVHNVMNPEVLEWAAGRRALMTVQDHRTFCPGRGKWTREGQVCRSVMERGTCAACFTDDPYFHQVHVLTQERLAAVRRLPLTVLSRYMRDELVSVGVPPDRIRVIPPFVHGLDPEAPPATLEPCLLFVGRLVAAKGVHDAVAAWRRLRSGLPLVFAGTGPEREALEREGARVLGWVPHQRLAALYRRARVVVLPSRWQEPFGIVGLEALSVGTPVAAWESGGVCEWHPGTGLVPWGDVEGLAAAIDLLDGRNAQRPGGFDRGPLMDRLQELYAELLAGPIRSRG